MEFEKALEILSEIAEGDQEREAVKVLRDGIVELIDNAERYRALYEGEVKRREKFRDIASTPGV